MPLIVAAIGRESIICCDCEVKSQDETRSRSHLPGRGELNGWGLRAALLDLLIAAWPMPDYLELASEAEDFAAWTPDQEKARSEVGAPLGSGETRTACTYFYRVAIIPLPRMASESGNTQPLRGAPEGGASGACVICAANGEHLQWPEGARSQNRRPIGTSPGSRKQGC
jgi:hypothetical protein